VKKFPHVYVILFLAIVVSAILTYIVAPNVYEFQVDAEGKPTS